MKRNIYTLVILMIFCFVIQASIYKTKFGENTSISALSEINNAIIGSNCKIMSFVSIGEKDMGYTDEVVVIGDNTLIEY